MEIEKTLIEGVFIIKPNVFGDERGYFFESFNAQLFRSLGLTIDFVQDNQSKSAAGVLRGLHYQAPPFAQGKLVRVVRGAVLDVALDIRTDSPSYGKYVSAELNDRNHHMMWVPEGMAHGFLSLEEETIFSYKCSSYYHKASEGSVLWNDPDLGIDWGVDDAIVSEKDRNAPLFRNLNSPF